MGLGRYLADRLDDVNIRGPDATVAICLGVEEELLTRDVAPHGRHMDARLYRCVTNRTSLADG